MSGPRVPCPACHSGRTVLEVQLVVGGELLSFALCSDCEWKSWSGLVGPLSLDSVLRLASVEGSPPVGRPPGSRTGTADRPTR